MLVNAFECLKDFLYPPSCVSCGELIDRNNEDCLCKHCRARWNFAKISAQNMFFGQMAVSVQVKGEKRAIDSFIASLTNYRQMTLSPGFNVQRALIFKLKRYNYTRLIDFMVGELSELIDDVTDNMFDPENTVFFSMPRNPINYIKTLNDGVRQVTEALAKMYGCKYVNAFSKSIFAKEQKYLSKSERKRNGARLRFDVNKLKNTKIKTAIIIDDVVTTGSTVLEAAKRLVNETNVEHVYIFSIAQNGDTVLRKM